MQHPNKFSFVNPKKSPVFYGYVVLFVGSIGVLASNPELYSNKRIMEAGEMRGHEMHFLNLKYCYMK